MPSFGERVGARGLLLRHCRCQAINRLDSASRAPSESRHREGTLEPEVFSGPNEGVSRTTAQRSVWPSDYSTAWQATTMAWSIAVVDDDP